METTNKKCAKCKLFYTSIAHVCTRCNGALINAGENMTQEEPKTMTEKDAWIAMVDGECVSMQFYPHRIRQGILEFWDRRQWRPTTHINSGPYSIVPDPSKPEVSEYEKDWDIFCEAIENQSDNIVTSLKKLLEKHYVRKGEK